ncbi:rCG45814 [Rattus norvegicus]|uniref:RCG45814 n=1 Tax=Rattus norvegicus TaxID=10116 RepID=A6JU29_RAT|nr:rCG45814 [Rattus norvegicus]
MNPFTGETHVLLKVEAGAQALLRMSQNSSCQWTC